VFHKNVAINVAVVWTWPDSGLLFTKNTDNSVLPDVMRIRNYQKLFSDPDPELEVLCRVVDPPDWTRIQ
jgi:hypothetical protein